MYKALKATWYEWIIRSQCIYTNITVFTEASDDRDLTLPFTVLALFLQGLRDSRDHGEGEDDASAQRQRDPDGARGPAIVAHHLPQALVVPTECFGRDPEQKVDVGDKREGCVGEQPETTSDVVGLRVAVFGIEAAKWRGRSLVVFSVVSLVEDALTAFKVLSGADIFEFGLQVAVGRVGHWGRHSKAMKTAFWLTHARAFSQSWRLA